MNLKIIQYFLGAISHIWLGINKIGQAIKYTGKIQNSGKNNSFKIKKEKYIPAVAKYKTMEISVTALPAIGLWSKAKSPKIPNKIAIIPIGEIAQNQFE